MTTQTATPVADFRAIEAPNYLCTRGETASFFAISPVKGARVEGIIAVGMTSHDLDERHGKPYSGKVSHPAMWVDFTPSYTPQHQRTVDGSRNSITVNGRTYGAAMLESVSGYVEAYPVSQYAHLANYGYPVMTIDGAEYVLRFRLSMFDTVTDSAHRLLEVVANAIAVEYLTDVRWLGYRANVAKRAAASAADALNEAQAKYDAAVEAMSAAQAALNAAAHK